MDPLLARGIDLFNRGEFFEAHEVWEEAWTPERDPRRLFLQSLIHVTVGAYHATRGNPDGAARQLRKALRKMEPYLPQYEGVNMLRLREDTRHLLEAVEHGAPQCGFAIIEAWDDSGGC